MTRRWTPRSLVSHCPTLLLGPGAMACGAL
jgi:hypothetical protein